MSVVLLLGTSLPCLAEAEYGTAADTSAYEATEDRKSDEGDLSDGACDREGDSNTVRFDANGGTVSQTSATAVEDNRIVSLPEPDARPGYAFGGWYTAAEGGNPVTVADDMSEIDTLYAHWIYLGFLNENHDEASDAKVALMTAKSDAVGLHARFFDKVFNIHETISAREIGDPEHPEDSERAEHDAFCLRIVAQLSVKTEHTPVIDMETWLSLNANAIEAIKAYAGDVIVKFICQDRRYSCLIPAGFDFTECMLGDCADCADCIDCIGCAGCVGRTVCVLCVAEAVGYEEISD